MKHEPAQTNAYCECGRQQAQVLSQQKRCRETRYNLCSAGTYLAAQIHCIGIDETRLAGVIDGAHDDGQSRRQRVGQTTQALLRDFYHLRLTDDMAACWAWERRNVTEAASAVVHIMSGAAASHTSMVRKEIKGHEGCCSFDALVGGQCSDTRDDTETNHCKHADRHIYHPYYTAGEPVRSEVRDERSRYKRALDNRQTAGKEKMA